MDKINPLAPAELPFFITGPGQTDTLFVIVVVFMMVAVLAIGVLYLNLHSIPDRIAHHANHAQLQLIGILTLIALFTHNNLYWVIAIFIAALNPPDFVTPINSIARSLRRMAAGQPADPERPEADDPAPDLAAPSSQAEARKDV